MKGERLPTAGTVVGRYELRAPLASREGTQRWEASFRGPAGFTKHVALELASVESFEDAASVEWVRAGARLIHPHIPNTVDFGTMHLDGAEHWYVARELVRGVPLRQALSRGPLPPRGALQAAIEVCWALSEIHATSVDPAPSQEPHSPAFTTEVGAPSAQEPTHSPRLVHRAVCPDSLWLSALGLVKLDGPMLATLTHGASRRANGHRPPEQWLGQEDHRCDVFAVGTTLFELVTAKMAFPPSGAWTPHTMQQEASALADASEAVVEGLGPILERCLQPDPDQRWQHVDELQKALVALWTRTSGPGLLATVHALGSPSPHTPHRTPPTALAAADRDPFFGREAELERIHQHVTSGDRATLTILGTGGSGKTRLALAAARAVEGDLPGGAWFVDATEADSATALCRAVAKALRFDPHTDDIVDGVGARLAKQGRTLLVLDNLEQIADDVGPILARWTMAAPEAIWLCTSRVDLHLAAGRSLLLGPLDPTSAVALFRSRVGRTLEEGDHDLSPLVAALDGLPLAIELAASRARTLSIRQLTERLGEQLRLLSVPRGDRAHRHKSMRAALQGSHDLLTPAARSALAQLSVFEGPFTLEAATAVLDLLQWPDAWPLGVLGEIVDASLLRTDPDRGRFSMLVVLRQFAASLLAESHAEAARLRHGRFYARLGSPTSMDALNGAGGEQHRAAMTRHLDNLRAAWQRAIARSDAEVATPTARACWSVLIARGPILESGEIIEETLAIETDPEGRTALLTMLASTQRRLGHHEKVIHTVSETLAIAQPLAITRRSLVAYTIRARSHHALGNLDEAVQDVRAAIALCDSDEVGKRHRGRLITDLGSLALTRGDIDSALTHFLDGQQLAEETQDDAQLGISLANVGLAQSLLGNHDDAQRSLTHAVDVALEHGNPHIVAWIRAMLGRANLRLGNHDEARLNHTQALEYHLRTGDDAGSALQRSALAAVEHQAGKLQEALRNATQAIEVMRTSGPMHELVRTIGILGQVRLEAGDVEGAHEASQEALQMAIREELPLAKGRELIHCAQVLRSMGRPQQADACTDEARELLVAQPDSPTRQTLLAKLGSG